MIQLYVAFQLHERKELLTKPKHFTLFTLKRKIN